MSAPNDRGDGWWRCWAGVAQALVTSHVTDAVLSDVGAEIAFQLPLERSAAFPALFDTLDQRWDPLLSSVCISPHQRRR